MKKILISILFLLNINSFGGCFVKSSDRKNISKLNDALFNTIKDEGECPQNVFELREVLEASGLKSKPSMVANRGAHNPFLGSFSIFESVTGKSSKFSNIVKKGDFFFGHFTKKDQNTIELDQGNRRNQLVIELISWDYSKGYYNFYELIGTGSNAVWFYRGDTKDAYLDNWSLKKQKNSKQPKFGKRMRCSACHTSGGPIMKEMKLPHNDWWTKKNKLSFGKSKPSFDLKETIKKISTAEDFSKSVKAGITKLEKSSSFKQLVKKLSLQEVLKPLFCTTEINLESSMGQGPSFKVDSSYWINPILINSRVSISTSHYTKALKKLGMMFPENNQMDAAHKWLSPVKGYSNLLKIKKLISSKLVSLEFVYDVLMIEFNKPLFSSKRCALLKLIPDSKNNWKAKFLDNLKISKLSGAKELLNHLTNSEFNLINHKKKVTSYFDNLKQLVKNEDFVLKQVKILQNKRKSVFADEISKNPMGQILEPGFRVIFPFYK